MLTAPEISSIWILRLLTSYSMLASWAEQNVDPSLFPQELMANASNLVGDEEVVLFKSKLPVMFCVNCQVDFASNNFCGC